MKTPAAPRAETITGILGESDGRAIADVLAAVLPLAPPPDIDARTRRKLMRALDGVMTLVKDDQVAAWLAADPNQAARNELRIGLEWLRFAVTPQTGRRPETRRNAVGETVALAFLIVFDVQGKARDAKGRERLTADRNGAFAQVYRVVCDEQRVVCKDESLRPPADWDTRTLGRCITSAKHRLAMLLTDARLRKAVADAANIVWPRPSESLPPVSALPLFRAVFPREPRKAGRKTPPKTRRR